MVELVRCGRTPEELSREFEPTAGTGFVKPIAMQAAARTERRAVSVGS
jgi:hypothetical protein